MPIDQEQSLSRSDSCGRTLSRRRTESRAGEEHVLRLEFPGSDANSTQISQFLQEFYKSLGPSLSNEEASRLAGQFRVDGQGLLSSAFRRRSSF